MNTVISETKQKVIPLHYSQSPISNREVATILSVRNYLIVSVFFLSENAFGKKHKIAASIVLMREKETPQNSAIHMYRQ